MDVKTHHPCPFPGIQSVCELRARTSLAGGFTLLELLVVITILSLLISGAYLIYHPLEAKAVKERTLSDLRTVDHGIRTFHLLSGGYPTALDSLLLAHTTSQGTTATIETVAMPPTPQPFVGLPESWQTILGGIALTPPMTRALRAAGITTLRYLGDDLTSDGAVEPDFVFSNTGLGLGFSRSLTPGDHVAALMSGCQEHTLIASFSGRHPVNSAMISRLTGLDERHCHLVIVMGLGSDASIITNSTGRNAVMLSTAPIDPTIDPSRYRRFLLMFHLATSEDAYLTDDEIFASPIYLGIMREDRVTNRSVPST